MTMIAEYAWESETLTTYPTRTAFRQAVAEVAARAKEILPAPVNGRVESAVKLVLQADVVRNSDGTWMVGSTSDPMKTYTLAGHACDCQDFAYGKAPEGWCAHRIAAGIQQRVQELLAPTPASAPTPPQPAIEPPVAPEPSAAPVAPLPEAPASVNCHIMLEGRQVQLTLRDSDETRLLQRLAAVLQRYPTPLAPKPTQGAAQGQGKDQSFCQKHQVAMKQTTKDGRSWWSHKTAEGWCKGR